MLLFTSEKDMLTCRLNGETIYVIPWGNNSIRVISSMMGEPVLHDWSLLTKIVCPSKITIENDMASVAVGKLKAEVRYYAWPERMELCFYNQKGEMLFRERGAGGALALKARDFKPIIGGDFWLTVSFDADPSEKLFGMGQYQQDHFDLKGCALELAHRNSQASVPFLISSKGYGFLWHNPAVGKASFNKNGTQWYASSTKQMDYWVTAGDTPAEIVESYASATGKAPMMPEYGLGFWQCKLRYWNQEQLLGVAREYKKRGIPIDVIVCDFFHWPYMGDFRFDEEFWPNPKAMCEELESMGIKLMVSVWPQVDLRSENYGEMRQQGLLIKPEAGMNISMGFGGYSNFFDATNPRARLYVWEKCKKNYYDKGVTLFWLDEAEPEFGVYDYDHFRCYNGPYTQSGNVYPQLYSRTFYEGMKKEGKTDIINLVRCAWSGSQRYGALVWSGDIQSSFDYLRMQIVAGLQMGLAGIPWWTTDIGGFGGGDPEDPKFRELFVRWFQYGTFCPVMRLHGDRKPSKNLLKKDGSSALFTGSDNEIWSFGEENYHILKAYIEFRELVRPYTRGLMKEAHEKGTPVMRTLFYEFPEDKIAWTIQDEYLYGKDLLVAPVVKAGSKERDVYLPQGAAWVNLHTGEEINGGTMIITDAPLCKIPLFIRKGSHQDWIGKIQTGKQI